MSEILSTARKLGEYWHAYASAMAVQDEPDLGGRPPITDADRKEAARQQEILREQINTITDNLAGHVDELELVGSPKVITSAQAILTTYTQQMAAVLRHGGSDNKVGQYWAAMKVIESNRGEFVRSCRADLGMERTTLSFRSEVRKLS